MFIQVFILLYLQLKKVCFRMDHGRAPTLDVGNMDKTLVYQYAISGLHSLKTCIFFKGITLNIVLSAVEIRSARIKLTFALLSSAGQQDV
jgi:hypothetical protein